MPASIHPKGYWNEERVLAVALTCTSPKEFWSRYNGAFNYAKRTGIYEKCIAHMNVKPRLPRGTYDSIDAIKAAYSSVSTRSELRQKHLAAVRAAEKLGIHEGKTVTRWTLISDYGETTKKLHQRSIAMSKDELLALKTLHGYYERVGSTFWIVGSLFLLIGPFIFLTGFRAYESSSEINVIAQTGYAMSGGTEPRLSHGGEKSMNSGVELILSGLVFITVNIWFRSKSRTYLGLPETERNAIESSIQKFDTKHDSGTSPVDEIKKLHALVEAGAITTEEFIDAKSALLGKLG